MTSTLPEDEINVVRLKQKSQLHNGHEESRSFINFSRENLSISNLEFEQNFNKAWPRWSCCSRQTILSFTALLLALSCTGLELWKLKRLVAVTRDVETLKRDVETFKHRFLEKDLLDKLKAFEEQLYAEDQSEDEDSSLMSSINGGDYDLSYDESSTVTTSPPPYQTGTPTPKNPSDGDSSSPRSVSPMVVTPCASTDVEEVLATLRHIENEHGENFEQSMRHRKRLISKQHELFAQHVATDGGGKSKWQLLVTDKPITRDLHN